MYNVFLDASDNNDSASGMVPAYLIPSEVSTTTSSSMEEYNNQPLQPSTFPTHFLNFSQTTASVSVETSPSMLIANNLATPVIGPSSVHHDSIAAITENSLNSGLISLTTNLESLSDTFKLQPTPSSSTVMPTPKISSPNSSSTNRWRCKKGNVTGDNREYIFPAIEMEDLSFSLWQDALQGVRYLYHVNSSEIGCSGTVTEIRFCYRVSANVSTEEHIFTVSIRNSSSTHVLTSLKIDSSPTNSSGDSTTKNCMSVYNKIYCCDSMSLTDDNVTFPTSEFILSIETSNSSHVRLQNFRPNVSQGVYNITTLKSLAEINITGRKIATTLPVIRFIICK